MKAIARQVAVLTAAGCTAEETARRLRISSRSVQRYRADPEVRVFIEEKERTGTTPEDVLEAMLYSPNEQTRLRAAVELGKLRAANGYMPEGAARAPQITVIPFP
jgi:hypothetical protein